MSSERTMSDNTVFVQCIGENGPMTPEDCAKWLDAKYARHGELEDKAAAQMIRNFIAAMQDVDLIAEACPMSATTRGRIVKIVQRFDTHLAT
jgi:hypothetical protein